jgi:hypothetical protein
MNYFTLKIQFKLDDNNDQSVIAIGLLLRVLEISAFVYLPLNASI